MLAFVPVFMFVFVPVFFAIFCAFLCVLVDCAVAGLDTSCLCHRRRGRQAHRVVVDGHACLSSDRRWPGYSNRAFAARSGVVATNNDECR